MAAKPIKKSEETVVISGSANDFIEALEAADDAEAGPEESDEELFQLSQLTTPDMIQTFVDEVIFTVVELLADEDDGTPRTVINISTTDGIFLASIDSVVEPLAAAAVLDSFEVSSGLSPLDD